MSEKNLQILELDRHAPVGHYVPQIMGNLEGNKTPFIQPLAAAKLHYPG